MVSVTTPNEVLITANSVATRYPLVGPVNPNLLSAFPQKIVIGDQSRDTDPLRSAYIVTNCRGGLLLERMVGDAGENRVWDSTLETRFDGIRLLPKTYATNAVGGGYAPNALEVYNGTCYAAWWHQANTQMIIYSLDADDVTWTTTGQGSNVGGANNDVTDVIVANVSTITNAYRFLIWGHDAGYLVYDGSTWTNVSSGANAPAVQKFGMWDGKLFAVDRQNVIWELTDPATIAAPTAGPPRTWTNRTTVKDPIQNSVPTKLIPYYDRAGDWSLHAISGSGVWIYDSSVPTFHETSLGWPYTPNAGNDATHYRSTLIIPRGAELLEYSVSTVRPIGLTREDGLPERFRGSILGAEDIFSWLAVVTTSSVTGDTALFAWDDEGWHTLAYIQDQNPVRFLKMRYHDSEHRLFWGGGPAGTGTIYFQKINADVHNPKLISTSEYESSGYAVLPWFTANWEELSKLALSLQVKTENCDADERIRISYQLDDALDSAAWTVLGDWITSNGVTTTEFGSGVGTVFKSIRFKIEMERGSTATNTPVLRFLKLSFLRLLPRLFGYGFSVQLTEPYGGLTPSQMEARLQAAVEFEGLVTLQFRRDTLDIGNIPTRKVYLSRYFGQSWWKPEDGGEGSQFQLSASEV